MLAKRILALAAAAAPALAQLSSLRATIPGSLHQCEETNLFFFESGNSRPLSVLFLPSSQVPDSLRTGTTTLDEAQQYSPLLALSGIETPDAQQYNFELQVEEGTVFELFGFLPDGSGKALSLTRTVTTPLPGATSCLTNIPTSVSGAGVTTAVSAQPTSASAANGASSSAASASSSSGSSSPASSTSESALAASSSAGDSSAALSAYGFDRAALLGWTVAVGGAALVATGVMA
ncbi:hypothetical protein JCM10450v2_002476 [Rhodotorula kratochvilovae]